MGARSQVEKKIFAKQQEIADLEMKIQAANIILCYIVRMIEIQLKNMLEKRGRSLYWLAQATDTHYPSLWRLAEGDVTRVTIETLDRICDALNCTPCDLLVKVERKTRKKGK